MSTVVYPVISSQTDLPFYISGIGISDSEYHVTRKAGLISHQFLFTKSGKGNLVIGKRSYPQKQGSIFYLSPLMTTLGFSECNHTTCISSELPTALFNRILTAAKDPVDANDY